MMNEHQSMTKSAQEIVQIVPKLVRAKGERDMNITDVNGCSFPFTYT